MQKRIQSLDGLRAISIILVVVSHAVPHFKDYFNLGNLGVRMFFVISSYLIVGILYRDVQKERFDLKAFYFKRIMRTFPAFYMYLGVIAVLLSSMNIFDWEQFWRAPIYLENYHPRSLWTKNQWFIGHSWSLAVEEQFYIVIALLFFLLNSNRLTVKKVGIILIGVVLVVPLIRMTYLLTNFVPNVFKGSIHRSFETVADALAIGGILALYQHKILETKVYRFFSKNLWLIALAILICISLNGNNLKGMIGLGPKFLYNAFGITGINIFLGLLMLIVIDKPSETSFAKLLNTKPLILIGLWSYSIYLWQQLWLYHHWDLHISVRLLGILVSSLLSYYFVEVKFLEWRDRIIQKRRESANNKTLD